VIERILSVGIDIGTSTTQVVFSRITIENLASDFSVPRIAIMDKEIIYKGSVYFTPLSSPLEIDMAAVMQIIRTEYANAGVKKEDLKTGAVIITGETARKNNAAAAVKAFSGYAGDFVVATAGPDLESVIAAKGAGIDIYSKKHSVRAANFDIGGGTSNFASFHCGVLETTGCLDIGGRLIKVDTDTRRVTYIAPKIKKLLAHRRVTLNEGDPADISIFSRVAGFMCEMLEMAAGVRQPDDFYPVISTLAGQEIKLAQPIKFLSLSGGVADYFYHNQDETDIFKYGDIGILLGRAIAQSEAFRSVTFVEPLETIRATVVGAGSHIVNISGSTIHYAERLLPLKNIPVLKLTPEEEADKAVIQEAIRRKLDWFAYDGDQQNPAIAFQGSKRLSFQQIGELASGIREGAKALITRRLPLVLVIETDLAKVMGQTLQAQLGADYPIICIDALSADNGDYIDIGCPIANGRVVPVVIKTLLFQ
jgi:ethanolamine utilization protein EutA